MTPTTPSGTRTRETRNPLGRTQPSVTSPTGSGRAATLRRPAAMPRTRASLRRSRSRAASTMPAASARSRSARLASTRDADSSSSRSAANRSASSRTELGAFATTRAADRTRPASCSNAGEVIRSGYKDKVVAMDDDLAAPAHPLGGPLRVHPDQALGEDLAVGSGDLHRVLGPEVPGR